MTGFHLERGAQWIALTFLVSACAPAMSSRTEPEPTGGGKADGAGPEAISPADEASTTFVDRLVLRTEAGNPQARRGSVPFSHRAKRWHVYHVTAYGKATYHLSVDLEELADQSEWERAQAGAMAGHLKAWVYRREDMAWTPIAETEDDEGHLELEIDSSGYGDYALVVGPRSEDEFLPRYPGRFVELTDGSGDAVEGRIDVDESGRHYLTLEPGADGEETVPIDDPLPARGPGAEDDGLIFLGDGRHFRADGWEQETFLIPEDAESPDDIRLTILDGDRYGLIDASMLDLSGRPDESRAQLVADRTSFRDYHVLQAIDPQGSMVVDPGDGSDLERIAHPSIIAAVPKVVETGIAGQPRHVTLERDDGCVEDRGHRPECYAPVFADDGSSAEELIEYFRATHLPFSEPSRYSVTLECSDGECLPKAAKTEYPIYLAHGFNSSHATWNGLFSFLGLEPEDTGRRPGELKLYVGRGDGANDYDGWVAAGDVSPHRPLRFRSEELRRNLQAFLEELDATEETRLNVIAHSMGGLDSRTLMAMPKYNDPALCSVAQPTSSDAACSDDEGHAEPCCYGGMPWSERIASVTTLSTPHKGSAVGDWVPDLLERSSLLNWVFRKAIKYVFGKETEEEQDLTIETIYNLSEEWSEDHVQQMSDPRFRPPMEKRSYDFRCAAQPARCSAVENVDGSFVHRPWSWFGDENLPRAATAGPFAHALPAPAERATVFSWGSRACPAGGSCGDLLNPAMIPTYRVMVDDGEADLGIRINDGVVGAESANFGIYMGARPNDHFNWTRKDEGFLSRAGRSLFGVEREPIARFYRMWMGQLSQSGY